MEIKKLGVFGAGLMGSGIAQVAAQSGLEVNLMDAETRFLDKGTASVEKNLERMTEKGKTEVSSAEAARGRINGFLSLADAAKGSESSLKRSQKTWG